MDKLIIYNLKMNLPVKNINGYISLLSNIKNKNFVLCPTSIYIPLFINYGYSIGIQNVFYDERGPYTGETSPKDASNLGVRYALIGHGDRRINLNEDDIMINKKVKCAIKNNLIPIVCVGETYEEYNLLKTNRIIKRQLISDLYGISNLDNVVIAYTPLWDKKVPTNDEIETMIDFIKEEVKLNYKNSNIKVIYGGGVSEKNIERLINISNLDGFLLEDITLDPLRIKKIFEVAV